MYCKRDALEERRIERETHGHASLQVKQPKRKRKMKKFIFVSLILAFGKRLARTKGSAFIKAFSASALPRKMNLLGVIIVFSFAMAGCRSQQTLTEALSDIKTERRQEYGKDSIVIRDSIVVRVARDTVYQERWRTEYKDRYLQRTDTIYRDRERVVETVVEKKVIPKWCWWSLGITASIVLVLLAIIIVRIRRRIA